MSQEGLWEVPKEVIDKASKQLFLRVTEKSTDFLFLKSISFFTFLE